jgi:hypothetical protein
MDGIDSGNYCSQLLKLLDNSKGLLLLLSDCARLDLFNFLLFPKLTGLGAAALFL